MKDRLSRLHLLRTVYRQFAIYLYLFLALILILLGFSAHPWIEQVRARISDATTAVIEVLYTPVRGVGYLAQEVSDTWNIRKKNQQLREENEKLLQWMTLARKLENENERLKKELSFVPVVAGKTITATLVADNGGAFSRSVLVRAGKKDGVEAGAIALFHNSVLGRVVSSGQKSARILLLTDFSSKVPVVVGDNKYLGIVEGNNSDRLILSFLPENAQIQVGDYVMTSGHGKVYPFGLAIGTVSKVSEERIEVLPFVQRNQTDFVRLIDYGYQGLLKYDSCEEKND